jgi:hypothetical protein
LIKIEYQKCFHLEIDKMGFEYCRFGCGEKTDEEYAVMLREPKIMLMVCGLWYHYAVTHFVQPKKEIRDLVLGKPLNLKKLPRMKYLDSVPVLYVEKGLFGYNHNIGKSPDWEFINKLKELVDKKSTRLPV